MLAIPAIDIRDGQAVLLDATLGHTGMGDPRDIARRWSGFGFRRLHIVDLDAAMARGSNRELVRRLLAEGVANTQVGGGIATAEAVDTLFDDGADWVIVGSRALEEPDWLDEMANERPGALIVALDVSDRRVTILDAYGYARQLPRDALDLVEELTRRNLALGGLLVTASQRSGEPLSVRLPLLEDIVDGSAWPVIAAGGITTIGELRALEDRGLAGAIVGRALYGNDLDPRMVADEFGF